MKFDKLFEPIAIGQVPIKNRVAMAPLGAGGFWDLDKGTLWQRALDYYAERAYGGVGLIITGATTGPTSFDALSSYGELAESAHYYGAKIFVQLTPGGGASIVRRFDRQGN